MSFISRLKTIIESNINYGKGIEENIDVDDFDEVYYNDSDKAKSVNHIEKEYYAILELEYGVGFDKIKSAYKRLLKKYHPDLYQNQPQKLKTAQKLTEKINEAYSYFERKYR